MRRSLLILLLLCAAAIRVPAQSEAVDAWIRANAIPLDASGRAERSLDRDLVGARLIGVGESVHEVEQFLAFRFALLQDLVRRHRLTALILETGLPEAMAVDDYVHGRSDTLAYATALGGSYNRAVVIREALRWLRDWNLGEGRTRPVSVYGTDVSINDGRSMLPALDRLRATVRNDAQVTVVIDEIHPIASRVSAAWWGGAAQNYDALPPDAKASLAALAPRLVDAAARWTAGSAEEQAWARRMAILVQQNETMLRLGPRSAENPRDAAMAANVAWVVSRLADGELAMVWAHNAHVQRTGITPEATPARTVPSMGLHLARDLGPSYFAIGTAYGGPALEDGSMPAPGSIDATVGESLDQVPSLLPFRRAPSAGPVSTWLQAARPMRFQVGHLLLPVAAAFDAVAYFDRVEPAAKVQ